MKLSAAHTAYLRMTIINEPDLKVYKSQQSSYSINIIQTFFWRIRGKARKKLVTVACLRFGRPIYI